MRVRPLYMDVIHGLIFSTPQGGGRGGGKDGPAADTLHAHTLKNVHTLKTSEMTVPPTQRGLPLGLPPPPKPPGLPPLGPPSPSLPPPTPSGPSESHDSVGRAAARGATGRCASCTHRNGATQRLSGPVGRPKHHQWQVGWRKIEAEAISRGEQSVKPRLCRLAPIDP